MSVFGCISRVHRPDKFKADHRRQSVRLTMAPLIMMMMMIMVMIMMIMLMMNGKEIDINENDL